VGLLWKERKKKSGWAGGGKGKKKGGGPWGSCGESGKRGRGTKNSTITPKKASTVCGAVLAYGEKGVKKELETKEKHYWNGGTARGLFHAVCER